MTRDPVVASLPRMHASASPCDHLYVVQFATGVIKVGVTWNPRNRGEQLRRTEGRIVRAVAYRFPQQKWREGRHKRESELLSRIGQIGNLRPGRREFFTGIGFGEAANLALQMTRSSTEHAPAVPVVAAVEG